jgi:hypothetical protein
MAAAAHRASSSLHTKSGPMSSNTLHQLTWHECLVQGSQDQISPSFMPGGMCEVVVPCILRCVAVVHVVHVHWCTTCTAT